jgi:hypothetical protein
VKAFLDSSQRGFWALDLTSSPRRNPADFDKTVRFYDLNIAETDGVLKVLGSVYNAEDNQIREDLSLPGPRLVSFANVLKHQAIPLPEAMLHTLRLAEAGLGCSVEIEFACEMGDWGRMPSRGELRQQPALYLLQVRPFAAKSVLPNLSEAVVEKDKILVSAGLALGNGLYRNIRDIVYVRPDLWKPANNKAIADEVGRLNKRLSRKRRPYLLLGPGRWGTGDPWLGIPVQWGQISGARVVVEASPEGYNVDPSQGTHFFHNITSLGIGYLTLPPGASKDTGEEYVDWEWLEKQSTAGQTPHLRQLRFDEPLTVLLDGRQGLAMIVKPGKWSDRLNALAKQ